MLTYKKQKQMSQITQDFVEWMGPDTLHTHPILYDDMWLDKA